MTKLVTLGCDPEIFAINKKNGKPVSLIGLIGGTKEKPQPVLEKEWAGCAVQEDNVAAEFNIGATNDPDKWVAQIKAVLALLDERVARYGFELAKGKASFFFPLKEIDNEQARTFGCDPDYCIYTMEENEKPKAPAHPDGSELRTAGGHIHIGCDFAKANPDKVLKAMDLFLGVPSVLLDDDVMRRSMYGKAGAFRKKPYGVEYRTLSNFWIKDEAHMRWAFEQTQRAIAAAEADALPFDNASLWKAVQTCIDGSSTLIAKQLADRFNLAVEVK